jgi:RTX calcium-binding nonapeptide repeat (4 copies)
MRRVDHASVALSVALCAALACGMATRASAQCSTSCNKLTDHIVLSGDWSGADNVRIGMVIGTAGLYPAVCRWKPNPGWWQLEAIGPRAYTGGMLTEDTSICTGGGNDRVVVDDSTLCAVPPIGFVNLTPLIIQGAQLSVSGEGGNDTIDLSAALIGSSIPEQGANICGGTGDDILIGTNGNDYISGQENNDYLDGLEQDDNLKAATGNDVLRTRNISATGVDKLRGETGSDCFWVDAPISTASTCGAPEHDFYDRASGVSVPLDCDQSVPDCCAVIGMKCPTVFN